MDLQTWTEKGALLARGTATDLPETLEKQHLRAASRDAEICGQVSHMILHHHQNRQSQVSDLERSLRL